MTTAIEIINDAYDLLEIKNSEVDLTSSEINLGIRKLNRMMTAWAQQSIHLGFTKINNSTDKITSPDWAEEAMVYHLALRLAPSFGIQVTPALIAVANDSYKWLIENTITLNETSFPDNLPVGAGNNINTSSNFYTNNDEDVIETNDESSLSNDEAIILTTESTNGN